MKFAEKLVLNSGFTFDYTNMFGAGRLQEADLTALEDDMKKAAAAVDEMRRSGTAYKHLSKDGTPEPVYFTRLADVENGNPNTPVSLQKLKEFGDYLRTNVDAVVFLGIGGSYLGNVRYRRRAELELSRRKTPQRLSAHLFFRQQSGRGPVRRNYERAALLVGTRMAEEKAF